MPKLIATIAITVIRDKQRITIDPTKKKAFDFTAEEVAAIRKQHPTAFRKPVNEDDTPVQATGSDATAPEGNAAATAAKTPKKAKKAAAAAGDSEANNGAVGDQSSDDEDEDEDI